MLPPLDAGTLAVTLASNLPKGMLADMEVVAVLVEVEVVVTIVQSWVGALSIVIVTPIMKLFSW